MKDQGKSSSVAGRSRLTENAAAGSQILQWPDQQQVLITQQKRSGNTETSNQRQPNNFSTNPLKLHPQHQSQQPTRQNKEPQRGQSPPSAVQVNSTHQPQDIGEHLNSGSKALSSSGKQQIGQLRSTSPTQPSFLKRAPSLKGTLGQAQANAAQQNLALKMPQLSENKWGVSTFGETRGALAAQHLLRPGHGWPHESFGLDQQTNNTATLNLASMPPAGKPSASANKNQLNQAIGGTTLPGSNIASSNTTTAPAEHAHFIDNAQRVLLQTKQQSTTDWQPEDKNQITQANANNQSSGIFLQQSQHKFPTAGRKIAPITGQYLPPFISGSSHSKIAPFGDSNQFLNSNSRRNFTTSKDYKMSELFQFGDGNPSDQTQKINAHMPPQLSSNPPINQTAANPTTSQAQPNKFSGQHALLHQAVESSEGDTSSTCNTRLGGFKAGQSAQTTAYNANMLNTSLQAAEQQSVPEISNTGTKFPKSVAFEIAKPQVVTNRGLSGGPKKNFRRQNQGVALSLVGQTIQQEQYSNAIQMTPGSVNEKHKQRINNVMNETNKSIKLPIQKSSQIVTKLGVEHSTLKSNTNFTSTISKIEMRPKLPQSFEKLQEEHMQQALPQNMRAQKKMNSKLMPPIKTTSQDTSTASGLPLGDKPSEFVETAKFQIQKDNAVSQSIRNKIKEKAKLLAEIQAQKMQLAENDFRTEKPEKKKLPVLTAIRAHSKTREDGAQDYLVTKQQETLSQTSNGTVPNVPTVSPEDQIIHQQKKQSAHQFSLQLQVAQKTDHSPADDVYIQPESVVDGESGFKNKEVSRHHTRLMLMQRQSKRLNFGQENQDDEEFIGEAKNEIELAQENADVSAFGADGFERSESEGDFDRAEPMDDEGVEENHDSILGKTNSSMQTINNAEAVYRGQQAGAFMTNAVQKNKNNRYLQDFSDDLNESEKQAFVFKMQPLTNQSLNLGQEQIMSISSSHQCLPALMGKARNELPYHNVQLQREQTLNGAPAQPIQHQSSNVSNEKKSGTDSSFARTFKLLVEESSELKRMYSEIIRKQLSQHDSVYNKFVYDIHSRIRQYKKDTFYKSVRLERRNRDLINDELTFDMVVKHIETEKAKQIHSEKFRFVHSDMSGLHLSNSIRQSHASIQSPDSNSFGPGAINRLNKARRTKQKRHKPHYNSFSLGLMASNVRIFTLPDLNHRHRNSLCNLRENVYSDNQSSQVYQVVNKASSNSNQTTPLTGNSNKMINTTKQQSNITKTPKAFDQLKPNQPDLTVPMSLHQIYKGPRLQAKQMTVIGQVLENPATTKEETKQAAPSLLPLAIEHQKQLNMKFLKEQQKQLDQGPERRQQQTRKAPQQVHGKLILWYEGVLLGQGTTGVVNLAMFKDTGAYFVVKKIKLVHSFHGLDQARVRAIKKEIDMYKTLKHESIVEYYGCEVIENNTMCIYLEYMPGGSIADGYRRFKSNYDEKICRLYTCQILNALCYLHSRDIVHGDLKGANVLLSKDGEKVKLCDLGNARQLEASFSSVNTVVNGTLAWMAPEAQFSKVGCKSDIWSLGCLLVEMLTGTNPWGNRFEDGNQPFMLQRALQNEEIPTIPTENVSVECQNFIARCLRHSYRERPHAHELLDDPWIKQQ